MDDHGAAYHQRIEEVGDEVGFAAVEIGGDNDGQRNGQYRELVERPARYESENRGRYGQHPDEKNVNFERFEFITAAASKKGDDREDEQDGDAADEGPFETAEQFGRR